MKGMPGKVARPPLNLGGRLFPKDESVAATSPTLVQKQRVQTKLSIPDPRERRRSGFRTPKG
jgi:hypothetical protein